MLRWWRIEQRVCRPPYWHSMLDVEVLRGVQQCCRDVEVCSVNLSVCAILRTVYIEHDEKLLLLPVLDTLEIETTYSRWRAVG